MNTRRNDGWSNYHALIASFESNNFRGTGLTFTSRYTMGFAKDSLSSTFADTAQTFFLGFTDQFHPEYDYGYADFDVRQRVANSFVYEPTYFDKSNSSLTKHLLGGWSLNGTVVLRSGYPVTIYDCSFASITCARLQPSTAVQFNNSNPPDAGSANSFTLADLSNQTNRVPANPLVGNYNFGPYPSNMDKRNAYRFDLIIATNIFIYYDVFDQSLAMLNIERMLRPGGVLLSNNGLIELPFSRVRSIDYLTVAYSDRTDDGDHMIWYQRLPD